MPVTEQVQDAVKGGGTNPPQSVKGESEPDAHDVICKGTFEEINEYFYNHELADGLPIVPPTREKVEEFLRYTEKSEKSESRNGDSGEEGGASRRSSGASSILSSAAASSWEAAADVLVPMAEDMAESAGRYLAEHGPDVVRERIVPKFIEAFEDAK